MEVPKKDDLVFHVALRRCRGINRPDFGEWDGDEWMEQVLYAHLNIGDFCRLLTAYRFGDTCCTQGIEVENGYILPALALNEGSSYDNCGGDDSSCYVSVCTPEIYKRVISEADKPADMPVLQDDFSAKLEKLSFIESEAFFEATLKVLEEMIPYSEVESLGSYPEDDEVEDELYKRICASLAAIGEGKKRGN